MKTTLKTSGCDWLVVNGSTIHQNRYVRVWFNTWKKDKDRREGKGGRCCLGDAEFLAALAIFHQDDWKKRMNRIAATCQNGCIVKIDEYPVHTIQNHHPTKMDILPKTFVQIILGAKWLVRHSSRRPQPTATTFAFPSVFFLQHHQTVLVIDG